MIVDFTNTTTELVKFTLDMLSMQHKYIANNIANANTINFRTEKLDFESIYKELDNKLDSNKNVVNTLNELKSDIYTGRYQIKNNVEGVELDNEMVGMSKNTIMYKALLTSLSNRSEFMKIVLTGRSGG